MMDDKDYLETQPLAKDSEADDSDDLCRERDTAKRRKSQSRAYLALIIVVVAATSCCSGLLGAYIAHRATDLDATCAAYTTQYCELDYMASER